MNTPIHHAGRWALRRLRSSGVLAGVAALLSSATSVAAPNIMAGGPAAILLPPIPLAEADVRWRPLASAVRASGAELSANATAPGQPYASSKDIARTERVPDRGADEAKTSGLGSTVGSTQAKPDYPPTFSSGRKRGLLDIGSSWKREATTKPAEAAEKAAPVPTPTRAFFPSPPVSITAGPAQATTPNWRWYGYGVTTPSVQPNSAAPTANPWRPTVERAPVREQVPTFSGGSTAPPPEAVPATSNNRDSGAALDLARWQFGEKPSAAPTAEISKPNVPKATLGAPLPPTAITLPTGRAPNSDLILPGPALKKSDGTQTRPTSSLNLSSPSPGTPVVARGLAPDRPPVSCVPAPLVLQEKIRNAVGSGAAGLSVLQSGADTLVVRFTVTRQAEAEAAVNRIAELKDLAGYRVNFEVTSR